MDASCVIEELLTTPFECRPLQEKSQILKTGRPCPAIPSLKSARLGPGGERHFHVKKYEKVPWLTGSAKIGALFCWPCLLFAAKRTLWNTVGVTDLNAYRQAVQEHERSESHIRAYLQLQISGSTDSDSWLTAVAAHNRTVQRNRGVLTRFIDCIFYNVKCKLPLNPVRYVDSEGDDSDGCVTSKSAYMATLELLSEFDPVLKSRMDTSSIFSKKAAEIKDGLVKALATVARNHIKKELKDAQFASVLFDKLQTMDCRLLCTVVRFVSGDGTVKERFISATALNRDRTKEAMFNHLEKIVDDLHIQDKLVAHCYDGDTLLVSEISGLCDQVRAKCPQAVFVHNFNHNLQSILQDSVFHIKECRLCVLFLTMIPNFFLASEIQTTALHAFMEKEYPDIPVTTWDFKERPLRTIFSFRKELLEFFDSALEDWHHIDFNIRCKVEGCISSLESFEGCFFLAFLSDVFGEIDELFRVLKTSPFDIQVCEQRVDKICRDVLKDANRKFERAWDFAANEAEEETVRPRKRNVQSDVSPRVSYRNQYNKCLENITTHIKCRFSSMGQVKFLALLNPNKFETYRHTFPVGLLQNLQQSYPTFFDFIRLKNELAVLYSFELGVFTNPQKLMQCICTRGLDKVIPQACRLGCLILTIPSGTMAEETWPETLKSFESTIKADEEEEDCSTDRAFIRIEVELLSSLKEKPEFYDEVVNEFAKKAGMEEFIFHTAASWSSVSGPSPSALSEESVQPAPRPQRNTHGSSRESAANGYPSAEPPSPISMLDIKEDPFGAPVQAFTHWTTGEQMSVSMVDIKPEEFTSPLESDPIGDGRRIDADTDDMEIDGTDNVSEGTEFTFIEVSENPESWDHQFKNE